MTDFIFRQLFDFSPLARLVVVKQGDNALHVIEANKAAMAYFSEDLAVLKQQAFHHFIDAENYKNVIAAVDACMHTKVSGAVELHVAKFSNTRMQLFTLNPIADEAGAIVAVDMQARPVSAEDTLRRERDDAVSLFSSIFAASDTGILVTDHHRRIVRVNTAFCDTYGWDALDVIGQEFTMLLPPEAHEIACKKHDDFLNGLKTAKSQELKIIKKDGSLADTIASSGLIELSAGRKFRVSTIVDITYLKKIEGALRDSKDVADAASSAKSTFLANMSHELRTPLNAIIGFSDLMIAGTRGPVENPHYLEYLSDIKFSALHLLDIINDVLDMSKIEAGQMLMDLQRTEIEHMIDEAVRLMRAHAHDRGVTLATEIMQNLPLVNIDQRMVRQILLNLISNAVKFSNGRGVVTLKAHLQSAGIIAVSVIDQGIGIPADKLDTVMQPFGQVQDPRVSAGQGTGLGLPLARTMVEMHGGSFSIQSTPDMGTTVTFTLPTP